MQRYKIYVVTHGSEWKVTCHHCSKEKIVETQSKAIKIAKDHVRQLAEGQISQILVQGRDSKFREEWTYGKDPYPPTG